MTRSSGWFFYGSDQSYRLVRSRWTARSWSTFRHTGGFRTVQLNVVGWLTVLGPAALAGFLIGLHDRRIVRTTVLGMVLAWVTALIVDSLTWRRSRIGYDISNLSETARMSVAARLDAEGITFEIAQRSYDDDGPRWFLDSTMSQRGRLDEILRVHQ